MTYLWHPWNTRSQATEKQRFAVGSGYTIEDSQGRTYIDGMSGAMNATCGHGVDSFGEVAARQMRAMAHVDLGVATHAPAMALADKLAALMPVGSDLRHTSFVNSGSEATELAIRLAHDYWRNVRAPRHTIVSFERGYHGSTLLAKSLTGLAGNTADYAIGFPVEHIRLPTSPRELRLGAPDTLLGAFELALSGHDVAAVIVEPLLNVGGGIVLPDGFLRGLRTLCDSTETLLIFDEVFCGFGRTGARFGFQHDGATPDIVTYSKGLASGYMPIGGVTTTGAIFESYGGDGVLKYSHTTGGHAVACAVALEVLEYVEKQGLAQNARDTGEQLLDALEPLGKLEKVQDVRGLGLVVTVEYDDEPAAARMEYAANDEGVMLRRQGCNVMAIPPLMIDAAGTKELSDRITAAAYANAG